MYLALTARPDIAYVAGVLARFNSNPSPAYWQAAKHVLQYLKSTLDHKLIYKPSNSSELFITYSNSDHGGNPDNGRSTGGYVVKIASLLDLLPPPSPLVLSPSLLSEQGVHSPAFHPLLPWEPSSSPPHPAFVHPLSPYQCLDNTDPLVTRFTTPPHSTPSPQTPPQGAVPCPTLPSLCAPPSSCLCLGNINTLAAVTCGTP